MQGANKRAGRLPKKPKLATDESATHKQATDEPATDEPATDEPATEEPATEPSTLESTDGPVIIEPNTTQPRGTSREDTRRQGTNEATVRSAVVTTMEADLSTITHADGVTILDEYFPNSAIDASPLPPLIRSHTPEALTAPQELACDILS